MNRFQEAWWQQAKSDHSVLVLLRKHGAAACHQLHYLQMSTEKLGKAYFWRTGTAPPKHHAGFTQFMRFLGGVRQAERKTIAAAFGHPQLPALCLTEIAQFAWALRCLGKLGSLFSPQLSREGASSDTTGRSRLLVTAGDARRSHQTPPPVVGIMNNYWRDLLIDGYAVVGCAALAGYLLWILAA